MDFQTVAKPSKREKRKSLGEELYDIDTETGREMTRAFEREFAPFRGQSREAVQEYNGIRIVTKLGERECFLSDRGAIVFHSGECGYRVVPETYSNLLVKLKSLDELERRRAWAMKREEEKSGVK